jgi:tetratricopeptide (TPR) repeat protein
MNSKYDAELVTQLEHDAQEILGALETDGVVAISPGEVDESRFSTFANERYEVESRVAEGGISAIECVKDRRLKRTVARKRLRAGAPPLLSREIRILSRLQHPNILPLYEAHFSSDGQPDGYTMPLLTGESLHDQAKEFHAGRPTRGNLRLLLAPLLSSFGDVCRAIGYAHSHGVWHLDLKGANVLVDASGAAVVIDWNMALTEEDAPLADDAPGTPGFQAPEQASKGIVGPATDVHGLGALLYELLTGVAAYRGKDREERIRRARNGQPEPPSTYWPDVPKTLEAICLKALSANPKDRFRSPGELWDEVDRWRNDEPVECFREPSMARLARWSRRHPSASGVLLTLLLATMPILIGWLANVEQQRQATADALDEARANFAEVLRAGDRYFTTMSNNRVLQGDGLQPLRRELLADGLAFYQEFLERRGSTPELHREIAIGWAKLAWLRARDESRSAAGPAARRALELLKIQLAANASDKQLLLWKAKSLIVLAEAMHDDSQSEASLAVLNQFDDWRDRVAAQPDLSPDVEWLTARAQSARASVIADQNPREAMTLLSPARAVFDRIATNHPDEDCQLRLASILTKEGSLARELGNRDQARLLLARARQVYQGLLNQPDPLPTTRRGMSTVDHLCGLVELEAGDHSAARQHLLRALEARRELATRNPDNKYRCHEASTAVALARLYRQTGSTKEAEHWLLRAHDLLSQCIDDQHPNSHLWASALEIHARAGWLLLSTGRVTESLAAFRLGYDLANRAGKHDHKMWPGRCGAVVDLGLALCESASGNMATARSAVALGRTIRTASGRASVDRLSGSDP